MLTSTELKEIRAVMCEMAARGCTEPRLELARKDLAAQFVALKEATETPAATVK